jgi:Protein of unknown function with PCYCGC motif
MIHKLIAFAAAGLAGSVVLVAAGEGRPQANLRPRAAAGARIAPIAPMKPHTGPLPALPRVSFDPPASMAVVQQVYEFAARHPEVLQYMPCYCGCQRIGHTANHSCFVKSRAADGRVTEWDSHGIGCAVCLEVGRDAMTLFISGAKPFAIREAIDKKYGPSSMPTPRPVR